MAGSGASWGTLIGTGAGSLLGPLGSTLGGLAGGALGGLFDEGDEAVPEWQDYKDPRIAAIIERLTRSKLGEQSAAMAAGRNTRAVNRSMEQLDNNPNFSGNPITRAAMRNQMSLDAEERNVGARVAGAQQDMNALAQAAELEGQQQQYSANRNMFERGNYQLRQQPTGLDTLAGQALGYSFGKTLSGLGNNGVDPNIDTGASMDPEDTMKTIVDQGYNVAPYRGGRLSDQTLSSTLSTGGNYFDQFNLSRGSQQPPGIFDANPNIFNYNYGRNPLRR